MSEIVAKVRLKLKVGQMAPTPAIASALGQRGVNIIKCLQAFNALAEKEYSKDSSVIVLISIFKNKDFKIKLNGNPTADLLKKAAKLSSGSAEPGKSQVGSLTMEQILEVAQVKAKNMHNKVMGGVVSMLVGTARSIGIKVVDSKSETNVGI